jgi:hypothetical protein
MWYGWSQYLNVWRGINKCFTYKGTSFRLWWKIQLNDHICSERSELLLSHVWVAIDGFLDWILDLLTTLTHNSVITLLHTLQTSRARAKSFPASSVPAISCLVTASNNGYSSASGFRSSLNGGALPCLRSLPRNGSARYNILRKFSRTNMLCSPH